MAENMRSVRRKFASSDHLNKLLKQMACSEVTEERYVQTGLYAAGRITRCVCQLDSLRRQGRLWLWW